MNPRLGGLILAGGQASRMAYCNKGLQALATGRLIDAALTALRQTCAYIAISANQDLADYRSLGVDVWRDSAPWQACGPLAGVASSVPHFPASITTIQILPCDAPLIDASVIECLSAALVQGTASAVYAQTASQIHPIVCQFQRRNIDGLLAYLQQDGQHSIRGWLKQHAAQAVWFEDESLFMNVNDAASLAALNQAQKEGTKP